MQIKTASVEGALYTVSRRVWVLSLCSLFSSSRGLCAAQLYKYTVTSVRRPAQVTQCTQHPAHSRVSSAELLKTAARVCWRCAGSRGGRRPGPTAVLSGHVVSKPECFRRLFSHMQMITGAYKLILPLNILVLNRKGSGQQVWAPERRLWHLREHVKSCFAWGEGSKSYFEP